jgi:hypothetical protein
VVLAVVLPWAACARTAKTVRPNENAGEGSAYLYGRFFLDAKQPPPGVEDRRMVALLMRCEGGGKYVIRLSSQHPVQAVKVGPSRCELAGLVYAASAGDRRVRPPARWVRPELFAVGRAYYIGDYRAFETSDPDPSVRFTELPAPWDMDPPADNFEATTAEMQRRFPGLAGLPVENATLVPVRSDARGGAATELRQGGGAPLSPERARGLAAFIKRSYATSAQCEAACPTGTCVPFRGESGPALTCVVRCSADRDCPAGLACNCPNGDGPDCRLVARTESDPMDGFCLSVEPGGPRR